MLRLARKEPQYSEAYAINKEPHEKKPKLEKGIEVVKLRRRRKGILGEWKKQEEEESSLEKIVFGDTSELSQKLEEQTKSGKKVKKDGAEQRPGKKVKKDGAKQRPGKKVKKHGGEQRKDKIPEDEHAIIREENVRNPAWIDEDDIRSNADVTSQDRARQTTVKSETHREKYAKKLQTNFIAINGTPKWAELDREGRQKEEDGSESDDEYTQHIERYLGDKPEAIPKRVLSYGFKKNLNCDTRSEGHKITAVEFHPSEKVALVGGLSGILSLVQVDGKTNSKIQAIHFSTFPISAAHFTHDGQQFIVTSPNRHFFYYYEMIAGKVVKLPINRHLEDNIMPKFHVSPDGKIIAFLGQFGNIHLLSSKTKEWITTLKMNGEVLAITFNSDGSRLYSFGDDGEVYVWNMNTRMCVQKFVDEGCTCGTSIAVSPNQQYIACGQQSGVVNLYDMSTLVSVMYPKPVKTLMNLLTAVTSLKYNSSSEILAMASSMKNNSIRLVHCPSMTVFCNFPEQRLNLQNPETVDFSPNSGYFGVATGRGAACLFRLLHYHNY